jgi:hypothetical protein
MYLSKHITTKTEREVKEATKSKEFIEFANLYKTVKDS